MNQMTSNCLSHCLVIKVLEKCCMPSAYLQWRFHSGERVVARGPLVVPRLFEEKWRDTVFGFPWGVARDAWRVVRGSEFLVGTLSPQLLPQFLSDPFETLQMY